MKKPTEFDYLLNRMENAARTERPHDNDYGSFRAALMQHVRAMEKNAERYRWLRDEEGALSTFTAAYFNTQTPSELDAAVDAAMAAAPAVGAA